MGIAYSPAGIAGVSRPCATPEQAEAALAEEVKQAVEITPPEAGTLPAMTAMQLKGTLLELESGGLPWSEHD